LNNKGEKMVERIKEILKYHSEKNPGVKIVKVTTTRYYEIPASASTPANELMKEWFHDYPLERHHAFREHSQLIEHFNGDEEIVEMDEKWKTN
jgi:hypothetical protein